MMGTSEEEGGETEEVVADQPCSPRWTSSSRAWHSKYSSPRTIRRISRLISCGASSTQSHRFPSPPPSFAPLLRGMAWGRRGEGPEEGREKEWRLSGFRGPEKKGAKREAARRIGNEREEEGRRTVSEGCGWGSDALGSRPTATRVLPVLASANPLLPRRFLHPCWRQRQRSSRRAYAYMSRCTSTMVARNRLAPCMQGTFSRPPPASDGALGTCGSLRQQRHEPARRDARPFFFRFPRRQGEGDTAGGKGPSWATRHPSRSAVSSGAKGACRGHRCRFDSPVGRRAASLPALPRVFLFCPFPSPAVAVRERLRDDAHPNGSLSLSHPSTSFRLSGGEGGAAASTNGKRRRAGGEEEIPGREGSPRRIGGGGGGGLVAWGNR